MSNSFYFNPNAEGLEIFLGPMEARLMEMAWKHGELTVKSALFHMTNGADEVEPDATRTPKVKANPANELEGASAGSSRPAYTTVMTVLSRLAEKGVLVRRKSGRNFVYRPAMSREQFMESRLQQVIRALEHHTKYKICF